MKAISLILERRRNGANDGLQWANLFAGDCPRCDSPMKKRGDRVVCMKHADFSMDADKFFQKVRKTHKGFWAVQHRSLSEEANLMEIAQL